MANFVGNKIPAIENLAVTRDQYDTIDLTDNELTKLDNFPILRRLRTMMASNNNIVKFDDDLGSKLSSLEMLILHNNPISTVESLRPLNGMNSLRYLSLIDCPVTRSSHYRLEVIKLLPQLRALDFRRVTASEREAARKLRRREGEGEGEEEVTSEERQQQVSGKMAKVDRGRIEDLIKGATNLEEIKQLERILETGHVPDI